MCNKNENLIKLINVIVSCETIEQLDVAMKYAERFPVELRELYMVKMAFKRKAKELQTWMK